MVPRQRIAFLIPAFHVHPWLPTFVERLNSAFDRLRDEAGLEPVLVFVDDGSSRTGTTLDCHLSPLKGLSAEVACTRHPINRGQGAAIQTALEIARSSRVNASYFATFDSDGQHDPQDVVTMVSELRQRSLNIVFGNRFEAARSGGTGIPVLRWLLLRLASAFERTVTGLRLTDAHNGLRVFDRAAADKIELYQDRMAHATEFKAIVSRHSLRYGEVPVTITYSEESLSSGQRNSDALRVLVELLRGWWFR